MKIFKSFAACAMLFAMASCSSGPADQIAKVYENAAKEIKAAPTEDDARQIYQDAQAKVMQIVNDNGGFVETNKKVDAAAEKMDKAWQEY